MRRRVLIILIAFVLLVAVGVGAWVVWQEVKDSPGGDSVIGTPVPLVIEPTALYDFSLPTPEPLNTPVSPKLKQTAWIPDWAIWQGIASLQARAAHFDSVSPVWYYLQDGGSINANPVGRAELRSFTKQRGIKLIPSIANFTADQFHAVLNDPKKLASHIDYLKKEVDAHDYDGLDLDYESIYLEDQPEYLHLVRELYEFLDAKDKILSVAVMPNWTDSDIHRGLRQTRQVQDWHELGMYVHELRIMTYNLTGARSQYSGPIAPLDWMEANLRYARLKVDMSKIVLGMHHYSYAGWTSNSAVVEPYLSLFANPYLEKVQASALTYDDIRDRRSTATRDGLDEHTKEKRIFYRRGGNNIAYYMDAESAKYRVDLAREYGIAGVAYWRMGGEDLNAYNLITK